MSAMLRTLLVLVAATSGAGCTIMNGEGLEDMVDRSIVTGSISAPAIPVPNREEVSDSRTVRNAVSAADLGRAEGAPLAWANADTGASGMITSIVEARSGKNICRTFKTSRQRFDGIALFRGEACTTGDGEWTLTSFAEGD
jgi:surface antigen